MTKFRLKLARQRGEKTAKEFGFETFRIDPYEIAEKEDILVQAKDPGKEGVSGCIVFNDDGVGIICSTRVRSQGFRRFTIAHELGHYFLDGHPEEILKTGGFHASRAGFSQGSNSIELEADHFASGLLMPTKLVKDVLDSEGVGLAGINALALDAEASLTSAAIRTAECAQYPMAIVVSAGPSICYGFMSESFRSLGKLKLPRKGDALPESATRNFNADISNIRGGRSACAETNLLAWFDGPASISLDEEVVGLGSYGLTLTVFSSEAMPDDPCEDEDENEKLIESWTPKFAYGR
ncbi:MAG: ImmA/IrrE family metallo-endopeptidase [Verrucomicrobia bacterium]|jgi:Zn-dependent peptidase ImmA (M78 family)|nr:ImmA/IrrE family metallo-endopeptidase [Verrucomicrobiota bacterium]